METPQSSSLGRVKATVTQCENGLSVEVLRTISGFPEFDEFGPVCINGDHWAAWAHYVGLDQFNKKFDWWRLVYDGRLISEHAGPGSIIAIPGGASFASTWMQPQLHQKLEVTVLVFIGQAILSFPTGFDTAKLSIRKEQVIGRSLIAEDAGNSTRYLQGFIGDHGMVQEMEKWPH